MKDISIYSNIDTVNNVKLNTNESYIKTDESLFFKVLSSLKEVELNRYPNSDGLLVREAYGKYAGVAAENIIMGNGSSEILSIVIDKFLNEGKKILTLYPDASLVDYFVSINEENFIKYKTNEDGSFNVDEFIKIGLNEGVDLIILSNPNNPTGFSIENKDIVKILNSFIESKILVDESYYEFNNETAIPLIYSYNNLLITRTLSKAWGLAAIRVGFLIANEELIQDLMIYKLPFNVNSLSQVIALKMLMSGETVRKNSSEIIKQRHHLYNNLKNIEKESSLEIKFYESKGNYIFGRTKYKEVLLNVMVNKGINIRYFENDTFRITVGSSIENAKVIEAITQAFVY